MGTGAEESKEEFTTMYGDNLPTMVKELFAGAKLNPPMSAMLDKFLTSDFDNMPANLVNLANNLLQNGSGKLMTRAAKDL